jgi:SAM-dependent methyltransferase
MILKDLARRTLSPVLRSWVRRVLYFPADLSDRLWNHRREDRPPRGITFVGDGDFEAIGREFLGHFVDLGGLRPRDRVLDVGCGAGRMAIPLVGYLNEKGSYEGFDPVAEHVRWCREHIESRHPNFRFQHIDLRSPMYNPKGEVAPEELRFPYAEGMFDFVFFTSVFTHMMPAAVDRYLAEVARVSAPGAKSFITWFLIDDGAERRI